MMDVNVENLRDKKLFKVHADITVYGQFTSRVIPLSISIIATNEQAQSRCILTRPACL